MSSSGFGFFALIPCLLILGVVVFVALFLVVTYNRFVQLRQRVKESWADIDVELKRRYDLIPNLVATAQGYATHEKELFETITTERTQALASTGRAGDQAVDERPLVSHLGQLIGLAEAYPDLKADAQFMKLQEELAETEDRLAAARRFYNGNVRELNTLRGSFPSKIVADLMRIEGADLFEVDETLQRTPPQVP